MRFKRERAALIWVHGTLRHTIGIFQFLRTAGFSYWNDYIYINVVNSKENFCNRFDIDINRFDIEDTFNRIGRVRDVWVARKPPGFAFVEMEDRRDAQV